MLFNNLCAHQLALIAAYSRGLCFLSRSLNPFFPLRKICEISHTAFFKLFAKRLMKKNVSYSFFILILYYCLVAQYTGNCKSEESFPFRIQNPSGMRPLHTRLVEQFCPNRRIFLLIACTKHTMAPFQLHQNTHG